MELKLEELRKSEETLRLRLAELEQLEQLANSCTDSSPQPRQPEERRGEQQLKNLEPDVEKKEEKEKIMEEKQSEQELKSQVIFQSLSLFWVSVSLSLC